MGRKRNKRNEESWETLYLYKKIRKQDRCRTETREHDDDKVYRRKKYDYDNEEDV